MENEGNNEYIDLRKVAVKLWENRKTYYKVLPVVFVLACAYTLCLPRYYRTNLQLVPELGGASVGGGGLADLASSFGIDLGSNTGGDAISPLLYPSLMDDNGFVADLFNIRVRQGLVDEGETPIDTTYYKYIKKYQKAPFWKKWIVSVKKLFKPEPMKGRGGSGEYDPYNVSELDEGVMNVMRDKIKIDIDKKTAVITISTEAQDPFIARALADSVKERLQDYITRYRTNKVRVDMEYYSRLASEAKAEYDSVRRAYAQVYDSDMDVVLRSVSAEQEELERDMQLKYNTYTALEAQYQAAVAKVQERTPAFTLLKGANVPVKHAGPKRMLIVLAMLFLACIAVSAKIMWPDVKEQLLR